jgi:hypothetical protein
MHRPHRLIAAPLLLAALAGCSASPTDATEPGQHVATAPAAPAEPTHPELRAALLDLRERDQAARKAMIDLISKQETQPGGGFQIDAEDYHIMQAVHEIDAESTAFLKETIDAHGWPTFDMVGEDGAGAAWLLAQHADADPDFQARVLALMEPLVDEGQARPLHFAMLTDRVLRARGEPQVYGTQFTADENGVQRPAPTVDWTTIDQRRASVGLAPMAEYAETMRETYGGEVSTEPMPLTAE